MLVEYTRIEIHTSIIYKADPIYKHTFMDLAFGRNKLASIFHHPTFEAFTRTYMQARFTTNGVVCVRVWHRPAALLCIRLDCVSYGEGSRTNGETYTPPVKRGAHFVYLDVEILLF